MNSQKPYLILELANFHGGEVEKINQIIESFSNLKYEKLGMKFQIFKYDRIALDSFSWYKTYQELFISEENWSNIISKAYNKIGGVWIDLFDTYGTDVLIKNIEKVAGIKLQASVLNNLEVFNALKAANLKDVVLMINVSGFQIDEISNFITKYSELYAKKIVLQIGYQSYPTSVEDTSLNKISILKTHFPEIEICYADHIGAEEDFAIDFPVYAYLKGVNIIEKHICLDRESTKYDAFSSMHFAEIEKIVNKINMLNLCCNTNFITDKEKEYLQKTEQKVIVSKKLYKGQLISVDDIIYRRTDLEGLKLSEIKNLQENGYVLKTDVEAYSTVNESDFEKATISVIVACRMKSSRLKQKAIIPIKGVPSVEMCLDSCFKFKNIEDVILATSTEEEDQILEKYTLGGKAKFWKGDPDDVIARYIGACDKYNVDVVIRVTADCPLVSHEITEYLLKNHFECGADYSGVRDAAVGTFCEIFNVEALKRVIKLLGKADYSEYMTWYMRNNTDIFKVNIVDLPKEYIRDYRLTLDYEEDLEMFEALLSKLEKENLDVNLFNINKILDENPEIPKLNSHITLKYKTDKDLIDLLNRVTRISIQK